MTRIEEKAIDAWAIYEYREHPKGLYHACFVDGYQLGYEQAEKDTINRAARWIMKSENQAKVRFRITDDEFIELFRKEMEEEL